MKKEKYVLDTSAVIEKIASKLIKKKEISGTILIPRAVVSELENQGNKGLEIGFIGLEEIQELRKLTKLEFVGKRPTIDQIKLAKSGEIDAAIREIAVKENAVLITADLVQAESGKAFGIKVKHFKTREKREKLKFEKYFDNTTMSVHLKENTHAQAKKGKPGEWKLVNVSKKRLTAKDIQDISKEIVENSRVDPDTFIEISRRGSTVIQYKNYRVVIVRPPVSDGWEITAVRPIKKLNIEDYKLSEDLFNRIKEKSRGIIIAGEPGSGKSTFAQALGEFYLKEKKVVKTVESPRDLQISDEATQYSKNFAGSEEIHDILFLSRPDNIIFDEMRDTPDFKLYIDLRLAGSECIGVIHSSSPIDSVQRFIPRMDVGMIPSVIDTILFIEAGKIKEVLNLKMLVKVPTGMVERDLARPVVEVRDFDTGKLVYEIYSYGEQTVVIPVTEEKTSGIKDLAKKAIEYEFRSYSKNIDVDFSGNDRIIVKVPEEKIGNIIGKNGVNIEKIENRLGLSIEVKELKREKDNIDYEVMEDKKNIRIFSEPGRDIDIYSGDKFLFTAIVGKKGEVKIHKKSNLGRKLLQADKRNNLIVKG